jgi:hypothetical protein
MQMANPSKLGFAEKVFNQLFFRRRQKRAGDVGVGASPQSPVNLLK